jgi:hypothetical protein
MAAWDRKQPLERIYWECKSCFALMCANPQPSMAALALGRWFISLAGEDSNRSMYCRNRVVAWCFDSLLISKGLNVCSSCKSATEIKLK